MARLAASLRDGVERQREMLRGEVNADRRGFARDYAVESLLCLFDANEYPTPSAAADRAVSHAVAHALVSIALSLSDERRPQGA